MAKNQTSVQKAHTQSQKRREANRAARSRVRTLTRRAERTLRQSRGDEEAILPMAREAIVALDKMAARGRLHPNNAAQRKSRLMKKVNAALKS